MTDPDLDPQRAAAEARLDRVDDRGDTGELPRVDRAELTAQLGEGLHIDARDIVERDRRGRVLPPDPESPDDPDDRPSFDGELAACIDAMAEVFNARDVDGLLELVAEDCETPGLASDPDSVVEGIEDLWERRPTCLLTRGELDAAPVGVLWELGEADVWWSIASVHLADAHDGRVGVIEFADDANVLDRIEAEAPDGDLDEGMRWSEWEDGVAP